jgi:hypothetical protein
MSETKELNFFVEELNWSRGIEWYEQQFADAGSEPSVGEASPLYTQYPHCRGVAERAAGVVPEARLVYVIRNPIDQMLSHYRDRRRWKMEFAPVNEALLKNPVYLETAKYCAQLERFLAYFPREQIHVVASEQLRAVETRTETFARLLAFLDVDADWTSDTLVREHNVGVPTRRWLLQRLATTRAWDPVTALVPERIKRTTRPITHSTASPRAELAKPVLRDLVSRLSEDIGRLRDIVGPDFDGWGIA